MRLFFIILVVLSFTLDCSHKMDESKNDEPDPCANAIGNGDTIISGPAGPSGDDFDQVFRSVEIDPTNSNVLYLGTERNGIVKSMDAGKTWQRLRRGLRHSIDGYPEVWDIAVSPANTSLILAATLDSPGPVAGDYPSSNGGVYRSSDGGTTWSRSNCGLSNSYATSICFDVNDPTGVVLGISGGKATFSSLRGQPFAGALFRSNDTGLNWNIATTPMDAEANVFRHLCSYGSGVGNFVSFGFSPDDHTGNLGFIRSTDGGRSWILFAPTLRTLLITEFDISANGSVLYALERDAFAINKSIDGGNTWKRINAPANGPIKTSPADADIVLFCQSEKVYRSYNGLSSWESVLTAADRVDDVEFSRSNPKVVYLAAKGYHVYKSEDAGLTWDHIVSLRAEGWLQ